MKVTVYLNEGPDNFRGFDFKTARLYIAAEFDLDVELPEGLPDKPWTAEALIAAQAAKEAAISKVLEGIFTQLNVGGDLYPAEDYTTEYRANGNRSLSVGDVVVLDGASYAVGRFGWDKVLSTGVRFSLARFAKLGPEVVW